MTFSPPYTITLKIADYLAKIVEAVTRLEYGTEFKRNIKLHRENRLRTIHSSLAIEGNFLSLGEVTSVIDGKFVAGSQVHIKEVKNAYAAYDRIMDFDPYLIPDFLEAHKLMTEGLVAESGKFRSRDVGVFDGDIPIHVGARPQFIPELIDKLFTWAKAVELHPVLKSAIVHYEVEMIHPFADGNGRIGRLWQTLLLAKWNPLFAWIPMESVLNQNRSHYYQAFQDSQQANDSSPFIEFILSTLYDSILVQQKHQDEHQDEHQVKQEISLTEIQVVVLRTLANGSLSRKEIFQIIGLSSDSRAFKRHIEPLLNANLIEMTIPNKPRSKLQKYQLTKKGYKRLAIMF